MAITKLATLFSLLGLATAHFHVIYPEWRADSLKTPGTSQWSFPCANISETTDINNRTQWPVTGGSLSLTVSHPWALTYVNLGIGTNVSSFNISLVSGFNQTGNGTFCLKETGKAALEAGLKKANLTTKDLEGKQGSLQIIQIASTGASLFNCADITFNASAVLLPDDQCKNGTGVGGVAIQNVAPTTSGTPTNTGAVASGTPKSMGSTMAFVPSMGGLVAVVVAALAVL